MGLHLHLYYIIWYCHTGHWGPIHFFFTFFSVLFRLDHFFWYIFKITISSIISILLLNPYRKLYFLVFYFSNLDFPFLNIVSSVLLWFPICSLIMSRFSFKPTNIFIFSVLNLCLQILISVLFQSWFSLIGLFLDYGSLLPGKF